MKEKEVVSILLVEDGEFKLVRVQSKTTGRFICLLLKKDNNTEAEAIYDKKPQEVLKEHGYSLDKEARKMLNRKYT